MELTKFSEAYNLTDSTDNWITTGTITIESDGTFKITSNTTLKADNLSFPENQWGGMYYQKSPEGKISISYNFEGTYKEGYVDYCEKLLEQIMEKLSN